MCRHQSLSDRGRDCQVFQCGRPGRRRRPSPGGRHQRFVQDFSWGAHFIMIGSRSQCQESLCANALR